MRIANLYHDSNRMSVHLFNNGSQIISLFCSAPVFVTSPSQLPPNYELQNRNLIRCYAIYVYIYIYIYISYIYMANNCLKYMAVHNWLATWIVISRDTPYHHTSKTHCETQNVTLALIVANRYAKICSARYWNTCRHSGQSYDRYTYLENVTVWSFETCIEPHIMIIGKNIWIQICRIW